MTFDAILFFSIINEINSRCWERNKNVKTVRSLRPKQSASCDVHSPQPLYLIMIFGYDLRYFGEYIAKIEFMYTYSVVKKSLKTLISFFPLPPQKKIKICYFFDIHEFMIDRKPSILDYNTGNSALSF